MEKIPPIPSQGRLTFLDLIYLVWTSYNSRQVRIFDKIIMATGTGDDYVGGNLGDEV